MKIYLAGKLGSEIERKRLEEIEKICSNCGFKTFLPHRDVGIAKGFESSKDIFNKDIKEGFKGVNLVVANLDGLNIGAGTAWELGYAYANKIKSIGIKTDEEISEAFEQLSAILIGSMEIVDSDQKLKKRLNKIKEEISLEV